MAKVKQSYFDQDKADSGAAGLAQAIAYHQAVKRDSLATAPTVGLRAKAAPVPFDGFDVDVATGETCVCGFGAEWHTLRADGSRGACRRDDSACMQFEEGGKL